MKQSTPWLRVGLPLAGLLLAWLGARSWVDAQDKPAADAKPAPAAEPARAVPAGGMRPWGDKLISVTQRGLSGATYHLENATITTVADRRFLVGAAVDDGGWSRKLQVQLAWEEVAAVVVFDSLDEFNERIREQQQQGAEGIEMLIPGFGQ
jgi:hypothetical protein